MTIKILIIRLTEAELKIKELQEDKMEGTNRKQQKWKTVYK